MTDRSEKYWLATYLYCAEPWEKFLVEAVEPFVHKVIDNNWAEQFFFIRYWEKGPHIRLRFKGGQDVLETEVKPELEENVFHYYKTYPSERQEPEWSNLPEEQKWFPNHSIQYSDYEPEVERYGGPVGILIAERQFELSSRVILDIIREGDNWSYDRALGSAIQLHLAFVHALGMNLKESIAFYSRLFENWLGWGLGIYDFEKMQPAKDFKERRKSILKSFEEQFSLQKSQLIPFHRTLWEALDQDIAFDQEWLNHWIRGMSKLGDDLEEEQGAERLTYPAGAQVKTKINVPPVRQLLWSILFSYVHMTNNRLGIRNRDEAYLGYLIKKSLSALIV